MTDLCKCNANAKISYLRCKKITNAINKSPLPFIEDDTNFKDCTHDLLSMEFARKSKDLVNKVKAMWSSLSSWREQKPFFRRAFPHKRWEGGLCQRFGQGGGLQFETKSCTESNCWHGCSPNFSKLFTSRKAATFISNWKLLTKDCWVLEVYRVTT